MSKLRDLVPTNMYMGKSEWQDSGNILFNIWLEVNLKDDSSELYI